MSATEEPKPPTEDIGAIAFGWWSMALSPETGAGRMARAQLRRAATPAEALSVAATHDLNRRLAAAGHGLRDRPETLALIATTLARLKETDRETAARRFGHALNEERRLLSETRFQTLIRCRAPRDLIRPLRRALAVIEGKANVGRLARDLHWWNEKTRTHWCFEYYGAPGAAPTSEREDQTT